MLTISVTRLAGGLFDAVRRLAQTLQGEQGVTVDVLALKDKNFDDDLALWNPLPLFIHTILGPRFFGFVPQMYNTLVELNPDLLHTHGIWMYPSIASYRWARNTRKPYILTPHGSLDQWALRNSRWKKVLAGFAYENRHLSHASCLHALCKSEVQSIRNLGLTNPICLIPNGIDLPEKQLYQNPPWHSFIENGEKVLLYFGRIHPKKGLANLLKAWTLLHKKEKNCSHDWVLAIIGWDQLGHEADLKTQVHESGMGDSVIFLGPQFGEAKQASYHYADAFILPSFSEGLPMVILEAWSHSLPVIMTSECNIPEGFENHAAIKIMPEAEDINRGLLELMTMSEDDLKSMGLRGRKLVERQFSWSKVAAEMSTVYNWMLGGGSKPDCVSFL